MNEDVLIKISGLQIVDKTGDNVEMLANGKHYIKNNRHYLLYEEIDDETQGRINNIIKFNDEIVEVTRKGSISTKLVFRENTRNQSVYSTPMGDFVMDIVTGKIVIKEHDSGLDLNVDYQILIDGNKISDNQIAINTKIR